MSRLTHQLSVHDVRATSDKFSSNGGTRYISFVKWNVSIHCNWITDLIFLYFLYLYTTSGSGPSTPVSTNEDWRVAFDTVANGPNDYLNSIADSPSINYSRMNGHSRRLSDLAQNGELNSSQRTPNRLPPPPPSSSSSMYRY